MQEREREKKDNRMKEKQRDKIKESECESPLLQHIYWLTGTR